MTKQQRAHLVLRVVANSWKKHGKEWWEREGERELAVSAKEEQRSRRPKEGCWGWLGVVGLGSVVLGQQRERRVAGSCTCVTSGRRCQTASMWMERERRGVEGGGRERTACARHDKACPPNEDQEHAGTCRTWQDTATTRRRFGPCVRAKVILGFQKMVRVCPGHPSRTTPPPNPPTAPSLALEAFFYILPRLCGEGGEGRDRGGGGSATRPTRPITHLVYFFRQLPLLCITSRLRRDVADRRPWASPCAPWLDDVELRGEVGWEAGSSGGPMVPKLTSRSSGVPTMAGEDDDTSDSNDALPTPPPSDARWWCWWCWW